MGGRGASSSSGASSSPAGKSSNTPGRGHVTDSNMEKATKTKSHPKGVRYRDSIVKNYIAKELNVTEPKAQEYFDAIIGWSYTSADVRYTQKGVKTSNDAKYKKQAASLEAYIEKAPKWNGGVTYRGVNTSQARVDELFAYYKSGKVINMHGTSSWSSSSSVAEGFTAATRKGYQKVVFVSPTQSKGTSIAHISALATEKEIMVSKGASFNITKIEKNGDYLYVHLKEP